MTGPREPASPIPQILGDRYAIQGELGQGGMALVYLARDLHHDRLVAIKVLRPDLGAELGAERFLQEIRFESRLQHPLILPLFDSGEADGRLFYVMPYVQGETLRARLDRETQLPVTDATAIARDVAAALGYAHDQGVVHRDIKPENILLSGGHAIVADFGIARAVTVAGGERITSRGVAVGTPAYMSPEQAAGDDHLDGRSDQYALGCVLYEMLAGEPPFSGRTAQAIIARHMHERPPSLRLLRPTLPAGVERAIETALAKVPADRFPSVARFAEALDAPPDTITRRPMGHLVGVLAGILLLVAAAAAVRHSVGDGAGGTGMAVDTTRYLVLPVQNPDTAPGGIDGALLIQDALTRWSGVTLVDPFQTREAVAALGGAPMNGEAARRLALQLRAGRYVRGDVTRAGPSVRLHAVLYDAARTGPDAALAEGAAGIPADPAAAASAVATLMDSMLLRHAGGTARLADGPHETRSLPARQALLQGEAAVEQWDLSLADSQFAAAVRYDPGYAPAHLWLALVRTWSGAPRATWQSSAERASANRLRLSPNGKAMADAELADARGDIAAACRAWQDLAQRAPNDFLPWYGWGDCLRRDDAVLPDVRSPTHWRYRSSYAQSLRAYQRSFQLLPTIPRGFRDGAFAPLRDLLLTKGDELRRGRALPPDTTSFLARASRVVDTLVLFPIPAQEVARGRSSSTPTSQAAVLAQRRLFHDIASGWVVALPASPDAMEALAVSLEMLGDRRTLDTLRHARALAREPSQRFRLAAAEVWIQVKFSLPADLEGLRVARRLADSLLALAPGEEQAEAGDRVGLAMLLGRAGVAARWSRRAAAIGDWGVPPPLAELAPPLMVFAALGEPAESLAVLARQTASAIDRELPAEERPAARLQFLAYPATLAFPGAGRSAFDGLTGAGDPLLEAQAAYAAGDGTTARRYLESLRQQRAGMDPARLTLDGLYPEAWLLVALGDSAAATAWLDPTLNALSASAPRLLANPARAGALLRAMALRAELAARLGDPGTAGRWAQAVTLLWSDADPALQPLVRRMTLLLASTKEGR